jgi:YgiT-type zinc finger domain-containing protein
MQCVICKVGNTQPGAKTLTFERGERIVILKHVAGEVCDTCGHLYMNSEISKTVLAEVKRRLASGAELELVRM